MRIKIYFIIFLLCFGLAGSIYALSVGVTKLTASDGEEAHYFGRSVAISGDIAVIGATGDDDLGFNSGAAYIYQLRSSKWIEAAKLVASDGEGGDHFGTSAAISGDTIFIGAPHDDDLGTDSGAVYIFRHSGSSWIEVAKLTASDGEGGDSFGDSVAVSNDRAVIGAYGDDDQGSRSGAAYIFRRSGSSWSEVAKLTASDGEALDNFGRSVAISGDTVVIGSEFNDDLDVNAGAAYIYRRQGRDWIEADKLTASDGASDEFFGHSVAISGDIVMIGAYHHDHDSMGSSFGAVYIFQRSGSGWTEVTKLTASDGERGDQFGNSVVISRNIAVIGAYHDSDLGTESGAAYIFRRSGSNWIEVTKLTDGAGAAFDWFGETVAISGDAALIGVRFDDDLSTFSGSAFIFDLR